MMNRFQIKITLPCSSQRGNADIGDNEDFHMVLCV